MGYDITMLVGKAKSQRAEPELDLSKPFEDGSGYAYKRDKKGEVIYTGRTEHWFDVYATIDLCNLGAGKLSVLVSRTKAVAKKNAEKEFYFFYGFGGGSPRSAAH